MGLNWCGIFLLAFSTLDSSTCVPRMNAHLQPNYVKHVSALPFFNERIYFQHSQTLVFCFEGFGLKAHSGCKLKQSCRCMIRVIFFNKNQPTMCKDNMAQSWRRVK